MEGEVENPVMEVRRKSMYADDEQRNDTAKKRGNKKSIYFKSAVALPEYHLEVTMGTDTVIQFDFGTRLHTARFGMLVDEELFRSVNTDGDCLIFHREGMMPIKITACEFMDLVLIDRSRKG